MATRYLRHGPNTDNPTLIKEYNNICGTKLPYYMQSLYCRQLIWSIPTWVFKGSLLSDHTLNMPTLSFFLSGANVFRYWHSDKRKHWSNDLADVKLMKLKSLSKRHTV